MGLNPMYHAPCSHLTSLISYLSSISELCVKFTTLINLNRLCANLMEYNFESLLQDFENSQKKPKELLSI